MVYQAFLASGITMRCSEAVGLPDLPPPSGYSRPHGMWEAAAADLEKAILTGSITPKPIQVVVLLAQSGDTKKYRAAWQQMLERFAKGPERHALGPLQHLPYPPGFRGDLIRVGTWQTRHSSELA